MARLVYRLLLAGPLLLGICACTHPESVLPEPEHPATLDQEPGPDPLDPPPVAGTTPSLPQLSQQTYTEAAAALLAAEQEGDLDAPRFNRSVARLNGLLANGEVPSDTIYLALALLHARYAPAEAFPPGAHGATPATLDDGNLREPVERAVGFLEKSLEANPANLASLRLLAFLMENLDDERAVRSWERLVALQPDHLEGLNRLGEGLLLLKRYKDAEQAGARALAVASAQRNEVEEGRARNIVGRVYLQTGRYDLAEQMFKDAAVRNDGSHWGCAYQSLGQLYSTLGDLESSDSPSNAGIQAYRAALDLQASGDSQAALSKIDKALEDSNRTEYQSLRGLLLLDLHREGEARDMFQRAAAAAPKAPGPRLGLAELALRTARTAEARQHIHKALAAWQEKPISQSGLPRYYRLLHSRACDLHGRLRITQQDSGQPKVHEATALAHVVCGMDLSGP